MSEAPSNDLFSDDGVPFTALGFSIFSPILKMSSSNLALATRISSSTKSIVSSSAVIVVSLCSLKVSKEQG